MRKLNKLK